MSKLRLASLAASIRAALADGAERETDPDGWLVLVRPDGRRIVTSPEIIAELEQAGLLPVLPAPREVVAAARQARPASWAEIDDEPQPGDRCCCGGRRWWCEAANPSGWCCATCHPPDHLPPDGVKEIAT